MASNQTFNGPFCKQQPRIRSVLKRSKLPTQALRVHSLKRRLLVKVVSMIILLKDMVTLVNFQNFASKKGAL